ncbi:MAG: porin [Sneathiellaceae bacterium]
MYGFFSVASQDDGIGPDNLSGTADDAPGANRRNNGFSRRGRIHFTGSTTLDNGLQVGAQVRLNALDCRDQIDQSYIWFSSQFGRLEYGKSNGVGDEMFQGAPNPVPHLGLNTPDILVVNQTNTSGNGTLAATPSTIVYTSKRERVNYFTPRIYGIQLGISYTPVNCAGGNAGSRPCGGRYSGQLQDNIARGYDIIETAASYEQTFGAFDVGLYGAYFTSSNGEGITRTVGVAGTGEESQWGVGGNIGYQGLALGGGYRRSFDDGYNPDQDSWDWNVGLTYSTGALGGRRDVREQEDQAVGTRRQLRRRGGRRLLPARPRYRADRRRPVLRLVNRLHRPGDDQRRYQQGLERLDRHRHQLLSDSRRTTRTSSRGAALGHPREDRRRQGATLLPEAPRRLRNRLPAGTD